MSLFENYHHNSDGIELEIERKGVILGIHWTDPAEIQNLAREALMDAAQVAHLAAQSPGDHLLRARAELFGLAALMLRTMQQSALDDMLTHGGPVWKTFGRALWKEAEGLSKNAA